MTRLKAIYRSWAIPCAGRDVYYARHRSEWLGKIPEAGSRHRAEQLYQQLDRFRSKRQLGAYSGLGLETRDSGEYHYVQGQARRRKKQAFIRGLNKDHNHDLKDLFKAAATRASVQPGPFQDFYQRSLARVENS